MEIEFDELIKVVSEKAGITVDQARKAVTSVVEQLKAKLPPALSGEFDAFFKKLPEVKIPEVKIPEVKLPELAIKR